MAVDNGAGMWYNGHMNMEHGANVTRMVATAPNNAWIRTCQECGHMQVSTTRPVYGEELKESYRMAKCRKCKSEALDYGTENASLDDWTED